MGVILKNLKLIEVECSILFVLAFGVKLDVKNEKKSI